MSSSADRDNPSATPEDSGFSLVEVIVALGVLMIVMVALLPQLVLGIQASSSARLITQAKGVAQGQLETMRNLPYHVAGAGKVDVLDTYYSDLVPPTTAPTCTLSGRYVAPLVSWTGYVLPDSTARCDYEPPVGVAFYRKVIDTSASTTGAPYTVVVNTRFLSIVTPAPTPVTPAAGYNSMSTASRVPSTQIGVDVSVAYRDRTAVKVVSTSTQFAEKPVPTVRVRSAATVTAVAVGSETQPGGPVTLSAGLLNLGASLTNSSTVNATLAGTSASRATGERAAGAFRAVTAPPAATVGSVDAAAGSLPGSSCTYACWDASRLIMTTEVSATDDLPRAGTPTAPLQALVTENGVNRGIAFGNSITYRSELQLSAPLLRLQTGTDATPTDPAGDCNPGMSSTSSFVTGGGYLATAGTPGATDARVESCADARTSRISLFPTAFAPQGVVVIELASARALCTVSGAAHTASATVGYSATVQYWNGSAYTSLPVSQSMTSDPLDAVILATTSVNSQGPQMLGDYIASWSSLLNTEITKTAAGGIAEITMPGVVTIASKPTRTGPTPDSTDPTSVVSVAVGALGCLAEDKR